MIKKEMKEELVNAMKELLKLYNKDNLLKKTVNYEKLKLRKKTGRKYIKTEEAIYEMPLGMKKYFFRKYKLINPIWDNVDKLKYKRW